VLAELGAAILFGDDGWLVETERGVCDLSEAVERLCMAPLSGAREGNV